MQDPKPQSDFLVKLTETILENISNEQFGVSELANSIGMSRSNLLRKVKAETGLSVSVFIRLIRLERSLDLIYDKELTISEISYQVGFNSPSYFIKCFHEHYGYPPGEAIQMKDEKVDDSDQSELKKRKGSIAVISTFFMIIVVSVVLVFSLKIFHSNDIPNDKSIAVLPFINDSKDSTNVYIINGLMESILGNLQKIKDLRVVSRTSVEKFRNSNLTIPEIARELGVRYFVEGSGQKINDQIMLSVQLIDANGDKHLWSEQYNKNARDVFKLQREVAKHIAYEIDAVITPEEDMRMAKVPTKNLIAYDYFLKGLDFLFKGSPENLEEAISWFTLSINEDPNFARAYADIAVAYYLLDENKTEKQFTDQINTYSDKALLLDDELEQSLIAKSLYYQHTKQYSKAVPYLEKALDYNPNSAVVIGMLAHIYTSYLPDISKYLEYAIIGAKLDIASYDSITASYTYLHISNALIQNGYIDEALEYIDLSLSYYPGNIFSHSVKAYILFAKNGELDQTKDMLLRTLAMDTNRLDVLQEIGKIYFYSGNYDSSYYYYNKYLSLKSAYSLDIYPGENAKIALTCRKTGKTEKAQQLLNDYKAYADMDRTMYKNLSLSAYYALMDQYDESLKYLRLFSEEENYFYWIVLFLEIDPIFEGLRSDKEFIELCSIIKEKFYAASKENKKELIEKGIL